MDNPEALLDGAKAAGEIIKASTGAGAWLAGILGDIPKDALGLLGGDWLSQQRQRHLATLQLNTERHLAKIDVARRSPPNPSLLMPLLLAAQNEADPTLQEMWAALLASSMVDGGKRARRAFTGILEALDPADVIVLLAKREPLRSELLPSANGLMLAAQAHERQTQSLVDPFGLTSRHVAVSMNALRNAGLIARLNSPPSDHVSDLGLLFLDAVDPERTSLAQLEQRLAEHT